MEQNNPKRNGQIIVILALAMVALVAITGLAVDGSMVYGERRLAQSTSDSAAMAGAGAAAQYLKTANLSGFTCGSGVAAGAATAAINGAKAAALEDNITLLANDMSINGVTTSCGVDNGQNYLDITTKVTQSVTPIFIRVVRSAPIVVSTKATTRVLLSGDLVGGGSYGLMALNKTATSSLLNNGSGSVRTEKGDIFVNSSATQAILNNGSGKIKADVGTIQVVGGYKNNGSGSISPTPIKVAQISDPLATWASFNTPTASAPTCNKTGSNNGSSSLTIGPGNYSYILNNGSGTLTLNPGVYNICNSGYLTNNGSGSIILGNSSTGVTLNFFGNAYMTDNGSGSVTAPYGLAVYMFGSGNLLLNGSGSFIANGPGGFFAFINTGNFHLNGSGSFNVTAQSSGPYENMAVFSKGSEVIINGSGASMSYGTFYTPKAKCTLNGSGNVSAFHSQYICDTVLVNGSGTFNILYKPDENFGQPGTITVEIQE